MRAVAVVKGIRGARTGQVGVRPNAFETVAYDEAALVAAFGQNVIHANLADIVQRALHLSADDPRVKATIAEIVSGVASVTVADDYLLNAARLELALADFWNSNRLSSMAVQCWPTIQRLMGISTCAVYGRLADRHMLTACESRRAGRDLHANHLRRRPRRHRTAFR